eukprot:11731-Hanusia_phi.AAC.1
MAAHRHHLSMLPRRSIRHPPRPGCRPHSPADKSLSAAAAGHAAPGPYREPIVTAESDSDTVYN